MKSKSKSRGLQRRSSTPLTSLRGLGDETSQSPSSSWSRADVESYRERMAARRSPEYRLVVDAVKDALFESSEDGALRFWGDRCCPGWQDQEPGEAGQGRGRGGSCASGSCSQPPDRSPSRSPSPGMPSAEEINRALVQGNLLLSPGGLPVVEPVDQQGLSPERTNEQFSTMLFEEMKRKVIRMTSSREITTAINNLSELEAVLGGMNEFVQLFRPTRLNEELRWRLVQRAAKDLLGQWLREGGQRAHLPSNRLDPRETEFLNRTQLRAPQRTIQERGNLIFDHMVEDIGRMTWDGVFQREIEDFEDIQSRGLVPRITPGRHESVSVEDWAASLQFAVSRLATWANSGGHGRWVRYNDFRFPERFVPPESWKICGRNYQDLLDVKERGKSVARTVRTAIDSNLVVKLQDAGQTVDYYLSTLKHSVDRVNRCLVEGLGFTKEDGSQTSVQEVNRTIASCKMTKENMIARLNRVDRMVREAGFEVGGGSGRGNHGMDGIGGAARSSDPAYDYRGSHLAADHVSGSPLHDVTKNETYPKDVYSNAGLRYYGSGYPVFDRSAWSMIMRYKNQPDKTVTIYRAISKSIKAEINPGDWVTTVRGYAVNHGRGPLNGDYKIIQKTVFARDLFTEGDSWLEWGYDPRPSGLGGLAGTPSLAGTLALLGISGLLVAAVVRSYR